MLDFNHRIVWIPVKNTTGETIPGCALMERFRPTGDGETGQDADGNFQVKKPTISGDTTVIVNGEAEIPPGQFGLGHRDAMAVLLYDTTETKPLTGDSYGSKAGSWQAHKGFNGFTIDAAGRGRAIAQRQSGSSTAGGMDGLLVKCNSATAASGTGVGAECYSATIKTPTASGLLTGFVSGANVWLTVAGLNAPAIPTVNRYYTVLAVSGEVEAATGDTRMRVIAQEGGGGGGGCVGGAWETLCAVTDASIACMAGTVTISVTKWCRDLCAKAATAPRMAFNAARNSQYIRFI